MPLSFASPFLRAPAAFASPRLSRLGFLSMTWSLVFFSVHAHAAAPDGDVLSPSKQTTQSAASAEFFDQYCYDCHDSSSKKGGLVLENLDPKDAAAHPAVWEKVIRKLAHRQMPKDRQGLDYGDVRTGGLCHGGGRLRADYQGS